MCGVLISALGPGGSTKTEDEVAASGQQYHETLGFIFAVRAVYSAFISKDLSVEGGAVWIGSVTEELLSHL